MRFDGAQLEALAAVVEEGTFEAAARRLHVTPSAVSQRVKALEQHLGQVLVRRSRPCRATEAGDVLVRLAGQLRLLEDESLREVRRGGAPGADVKVELDLIRDCEVIALVYPIWFGMPPAIIKGYVDRVLGAGFAAANLMEGTPSALLHGKRLIMFSSSASTRPWLEEQGQFQGLRQAFGLYLQTAFGFRETRHVHFDAVVEGGKPHYVDECLASVKEATRQLCATLLHERRHARFEKRAG